MWVDRNNRQRAVDLGSVRGIGAVMMPTGTVNLSLSKREVAPSKVVGLRIQQTHVSWRHVRKERSRSIRWLAELTR